ncbi:potassium channel family protein [Planctomicrobium sp. SH664]|uniref:potassium channel family protein n=1 Tax=Planctomicrobium sp. SH664 TaxID=3448125 RepID=UPI003F5BD218
MKSLAISLSFLTNPARRRNLLILARMLLVFMALVAVYSLAFHFLMRAEGKEYSWVTGTYWTLTVMSTLGFGDITFSSDLGRIFSVIVLLSGTVFMLVVLPFMFIQFFYVPWLEAQAAARAPRSLPASMAGHVILTGLGPVEQTLIRRLNRSHVNYVLLVADLTEALRLHDEGYRVMLGNFDDPETYYNAQVKQAALVVALQKDTTNTNIAFTVRETSESISIVASAAAEPSIDILELAGCTHVLQLSEMLGEALARHVVGRDARSRVIGHFGDLLIAEAVVAGTPMVGRTLREIRLGDHAQVTVIGLWDRGKFHISGPESVLTATSVLVLAGSRSQLDEYDSLFCIYRDSSHPVVILGGGRVGRATARELARQSVNYRIVERLPERATDTENYVIGDAAQLEVLQRAGIMEASSVVITTHDDDMNVYLAIYCRRLRPDIQIVGRANQDRNITTLHRAGVDFVMSYASTGANVIFNLLQQGKILLLAEGLDIVRLPVPKALVGQSLAESRLRQTTGCNVVAVVQNGVFEVNPNPHQPLPAGAELIVIGDSDAEGRFFAAWTNS